MTAETDIRTAIETLFLADFAAARPTTSISVENDSFSPGNDSWVRLSILYSSASFLSLGTTSQRYRGYVQVEIHTPIGEGTQEIDSIAGDVGTIFRGRTVDGVNYGDPIPPKPLVVQDGWFSGAVLVPFRADVFN